MLLLASDCIYRGRTAGGILDATTRSPKPIERGGTLSTEREYFVGLVSGHHAVQRMGAELLAVRAESSDDLVAAFRVVKRLIARRDVDNLHALSK